VVPASEVIGNVKLFLLIRNYFPGDEITKKSRVIDKSGIKYLGIGRFQIGCVI
jgi:hypothetical protein